MRTTIEQHLSEKKTQIHLWRFLCTA